MQVCSERWYAKLNALLQCYRAGSILGFKKRSFISTLTLLISALLGLLYYGPVVKYIWPFSLALELWPYLAAIAGLAFLLVIFTPSLRKQRIRLGVATFLLVLCWTPILSWIGRPSIAADPQGIRVMAYNLWIDNPKIDEIEQSIEREKPDILFLSEVSQGTMDKLRSRLDYRYNYRTTGSNNALFTSYPLLEAKTDALGVTTVGRTFSLVAKLKIGDDIVNILGVHPVIPVLPELSHIRNQQLDSFAQVGRDLKGKVIVLGDFNATPWSPYFQRFERIGNLQNTGKGQGIWASWYFNQTLKSRFIKIPIDHIETRGFQPLKTWVGQAGGSDHKPIISVLKPS